jgi:multiple sugar transport system substrate-binding protein
MLDSSRKWRRFKLLLDKRFHPDYHIEEMKTLKTVIPFLILALMFSQCGNSQKEAEEKITLHFWQFWTDPEVKPAIESLIRQFEEENPEIEISLTDLTWADGHEKLVVAFSSNTAPDVLELGSDWVPEFSSGGVLLDVTDFAEKIKPGYLMWDPVIYQEKIYGFPWILDTRVIFYNRDLMHRVGLDPEKPPQTWDALLDYCETINGLKPQAYGFGANSFERHRLYKKFLPFFWSNGAKILSEDEKVCLINSKEGKEALRFYKELTEQGVIDTQRMLDEQFKNNKIGFLLSGGWLLHDIRKNHPELNFGLCLVPRPEKDKGKNASFAGGEYLVVNKKTQHPQEAIKLIQFLIKKENCLQLCKKIGSASPSATDAIKDPYYQEDPNLLLFQLQLQKAISPPAHPKWVYMEEIIEKAVEEVMYDKTSPEEALDQAKKKIDDFLR